MYDPMAAAFASNKPCRWAIFMRDVNCFFHFVRRFWNHVLICTSVRLSTRDRSRRLLTLRYLSCLNSVSSRSSCFALYAWRGFRSMPDLRVRLPLHLLPEETVWEYLRESDVWSDENACAKNVVQITFSFCRWIRVELVICVTSNEFRTYKVV